jgi:hypothetical protein
MKTEYEKRRLKKEKEGKEEVNLLITPRYCHSQFISDEIMCHATHLQLSLRFSSHPA